MKEMQYVTDEFSSKLKQGLEEDCSVVLTVCCAIHEEWTTSSQIDLYIDG